MKKVLLSAFVLSVALLGCTEKQQAEVEARAKEKVDTLLEDQNRKASEDKAAQEAFNKSLDREPASSGFQYKGPTAAEMAAKNRKENKEKTQNAD